MTTSSLSALHTQMHLPISILVHLTPSYLNLSPSNLSSLIQSTSHSTQHFHQSSLQPLYQCALYSTSLTKCWSFLNQFLNGSWFMPNPLFYWRWLHIIQIYSTVASEKIVTRRLILRCERIPNIVSLCYHFLMVVCCVWQVFVMFVSCACPT